MKRVYLIAVVRTYSLFLSLSLPVSETRDRKEEEKYAFSRLPGHEISRKFPRKVSPRSGIPPGQLNSRNRTRSLMQARARWNTEKGRESNPVVGERYYLFDSRILRAADTRIYLDIPTVSICSRFDWISSGVRFPRRFRSSFDPH